MANSVYPDQTAPIEAVCSWSTLLASILNSSVMLGNYLQQTTSADDIFRCIFFLGALRVNRNSPLLRSAVGSQSVVSSCRQTARLSDLGSRILQARIRLKLSGMCNVKV